MVKRGPKVDRDSTLKRRLVKEVFENFPNGLSVRDTIDKVRKRGILSSPNKILELLRELHREGILDHRMVKGGKGPSRKLYFLSSMAKTIPDATKIKETLNLRRNVLSLGIAPLVEELQRSTVRYWADLVLEAANKAGVIEQLKDNRDKVNFSKRLIANIGKRGADVSVGLLRLTDVSFALIQSILTYAFLEETVLQHRLVDEKRYNLVKGIEMACEETGEQWKNMVKEKITNSFFHS